MNLQQATSILLLALATALPVRTIAAGAPPADDPFAALIADIERNVAPDATPLQTVVLKDDRGRAIRTVIGGSEVISDAKDYAYPDGAELRKKVLVRHVTFKSVPVYKDGSFHDDTTVYAQIAQPADANDGKKLPGILLLHGGGGFVQSSSISSRVLQWAAAGYVVIACDLPGVANPEFADASSGTWCTVPYSNIVRFTADPDIRASWTYTDVATALKAFALLKAQPTVDPARIGIVGISWGGYTTTMLCGLLGSQVAAGFSVFGCGFYDQDSAWKDFFVPEPKPGFFKNQPGGLEKWKSVGAVQWLTYLDAGRRAGNIKAHFYIAASANDHFFRPPAVVKTLEAITGAASLGFQFSPNSQSNPADANPAHDIGYYCVKSSHNILTPGGNVTPPTFQPVKPVRGWCQMESVYFDYWLKGIGAPPPVIRLVGKPQADSKKNLEIKFAVTADPSVNLQLPKLYYSEHTATDTWQKRNWIPLNAPVTENGMDGNTHQYAIAMPAEIVAKNVDWYLLVSDLRGAFAATVSTLVRNAGGDSQ